MRDLAEAAQRQRAHAEGCRQDLRLAQLRDEFRERAEETGGRQGVAEELAELAADDAQGDAVQVAHENRTRQEIGQEAQPGHARHDAEEPREQR